MNHRFAIAAGTMLAVAGLAAQAHAATTVKVTIEDPTKQVTSTTLQHGGIETFEGLNSTGVQNFTSNFGTTGITGRYTGVNVHQVDQYGGADGTGNYAVSGLSSKPSSYTIDFSGSTQPLNYFGYWLSALDPGNSVAFYSGNDLLFTFNPSDVLAFVGPHGSNYLDGAYYGNPNTTPRKNDDEPYVFVNFYLEGENATFDKIVFSQTATNPTAGYESDNHTVGWYTDQTGTEVPAVPEPATWGMMILGFGLIGMAARRRRPTRTTVTFA